MFCYDRWRKTLQEPSAAAIQQALHALLKNFRDATLDQAAADTSDVATIRATVNSYQELDPQLTLNYVVQWEEPFLADTRAYYQQLCGNFLQSENVSSYLGFCDRLLDLEELVSAQFLHSKTKERHKQCVNEVVIINHRERLREAVFDFVQEGRNEELRRLHRLFERIQDLDPLLDIFSNYVKNSLISVFTKLVPAAESTEPAARDAFPALYCRAFLQQYHQLENTVETAFLNGLRFRQTLERAGREVLNNNAINREDDPQEPSARHTAKFADTLLTDAKVEFQVLMEDALHLKGVVLIFSLLASKDVFCKNYKVLFMNRLLKDKMRNRDSEMGMIQMMRSIHDLQFSNVLTVMLRDIDNSRAKYGLASEFLPPSDIAADPLILTLGSWPLNAHDQSLTMKLPDELEALSQVFLTKFQKVNSGKIVEWLHERSTALVELRVNGTPPKTYRITMNHLQLAAFQAVYTFPSGTPSSDNIAAILEVPPDWLQRTLDSLAACTLFQQNPKNKLWRINPTFKANNVNLNASVKFIRPVAETTVDPQIEEDRELSTQAAIVRIMKARRVLDHSTLCDETTRQTSRFFPQKIERIKRQIEKLINGQVKYLERVDHKTYKYVTGTDP